MTMTLRLVLAVMSDLRPDFTRVFF